MLVFTCCALPISLRVVDSLRHTHAFSCVTLRDFLMKWATMAAPMVSENVCFKINFMMNNILTKLNKKYMCYNILFFMNFQHWLHVPLIVNIDQKVVTGKILYSVIFIDIPYCNVTMILQNIKI